MPATLDDSSLQLSISAETVIPASHFKLPLPSKNMNLRPLSFTKAWQDAN
jgi:hypothetical protein